MEERNSEELFMEELKNEFLEKTAVNLKRMSELSDNSDFLEIRRIAHDIKGTAGIFDLEKGSEIAMKLQNAADNENGRDVEILIDELILYMKNEGIDI